MHSQDARASSEAALKFKMSKSGVGGLSVFCTHGDRRRFSAGKSGSVFTGSGFRTGLRRVGDWRRNVNVSLGGADSDCQSGAGDAVCGSLWKLSLQVRFMW